MITASILDLPIADELRDDFVDLPALFIREHVARVNYAVAHGERVILSSNPFDRVLTWPVTIIEPKP